ncbi:hypothetical protein [Natronomonas amylolytica]|uniref:hypothetical protein n=1 Tax=Natronomonas amylolytica TaxID=3108498 RepID=UPI003007F47D
MTTTVPAKRPSPTDATPRQKTMLFCPDCDHESDIDGDWTVHEEPNRRVYECPVCSTTIAKRPRPKPLLSP